MRLKEMEEKERQYREKALNYQINEKGFSSIMSDDKATVLFKGSLKLWYMIRRQAL